MMKTIENLQIGSQVFVVDLINKTINRVEIGSRYESVYGTPTILVKVVREGTLTLENIPGDTEYYLTYEEARNSAAYQFLLKNGLEESQENNDELDVAVLAKKQQMLREEHHYSVEPYSIKIHKMDGTIDRWLFNVKGLGKDSFIYSGGMEEHYSTYEEALDAGIKYTTESLVKKK